MTEHKTLPADVARCDGVVGLSTICPQRQSCLRFLSPPHGRSQVGIFVMDENKTGECEYFIETEGAK